MERYSTFLDRRTNTVKMTILPNAKYKFSLIPIKLPVALIPIKLPVAFFTELEQNTSQFI